VGSAPGLRLSDSELNQVRHHAVLGHGLAVQAIRARGPAATKVGFADNVRVAVPVIDTPAYVTAAETAPREGNPGYITVMLEAATPTPTSPARRRQSSARTSWGRLAPRSTSWASTSQRLASHDGVGLACL
jgi:beta-glucosidase/6-phospho-beta-glucosidase/beta-galactosidase